MTVSQISVFAESKPGHLSRILNYLEDADVSVRGYSLSDTGDYGIARFVVDKPEIGYEALQNAGCACVKTDVLCLKLVDEPGELARIVDVLAARNINILYSYSMISTYIVLATDDAKKTKEVLADEPVETISQEDILRIVNERKAAREA